MLNDGTSASTGKQILKPETMRGNVPCTGLRYARIHKTFIVECDASGNEICAVLMQEGRPIAFESHEKEMLAILHALKK